MLCHAVCRQTGLGKRVFLSKALSLACLAHPGAAAGHVDNDDVAGRTIPSFSLSHVQVSSLKTPKLRNEGNHLLRDLPDRFDRQCFGSLNGLLLNVSYLSTRSFAVTAQSLTIITRTVS